MLLVCIKAVDAGYLYEHYLNVSIDIRFKSINFKKYAKLCVLYFLKPTKSFEIVIKINKGNRRLQSATALPLNCKVRPQRQALVLEKYRSLTGFDISL